MSSMHIMHTNQVIYTHYIHINHNYFYSVRHMPMPLYTMFQNSLSNATLITQDYVQF